MSKSLPALMFLCLFCIAARATTTHMGRVVDEAGQPLSAALVSDGRIQVFTAKDGIFYLATTADSIWVQKLGYQTRRLAYKDIIRPVVLNAEPIILPKVTVTETALDIFSPPPDRISLPLDPDRHYYSAGEMLSASPAVHSGDVRLKGESQGISLLGNLSRHTLVLLDGVPLNPDGGAYDLSLLDPANIATIELIKNNASVYGGGSAIGGIVRVTTRQGSLSGGQKFDLATELGSFGYAQNSFAYSTSRPAWNLRLSLANLNTDNDFTFRLPDWWGADSTLTRTNNAKRQNSLSASYSRRFRDTRLSLQTDYTNFHRELPGTVNFLEVYRNAYLEGWSNRNRLALDAPLLGLNSGLLIWLNLDRGTYNNTRAPLSVYVSRYRQNLGELGLRGSLGHKLDLAPMLAWNSGLAAEAGLQSYQNLNLLNPALDLDHASRWANASLKSGLELSSGLYQATASAALRFDHSERDDNLSWRGEASLKRFGWLETTLGGTFGTSFALPSPYDLYWKGDSQALGNPDLESETSQGWQLWLENRRGPWSVKASWHHNSIDHLIQWRQIQMFGNVWKPLNIGQARIRNLEAEAAVQPWDWLKLSASALWTEALDLSSLPPELAPSLMYTPDLGWSLRLDLAWKKLSFWSAWSHTGRQYTTPDNLADPLPAYDLLDLGLSWTHTIANWKLNPHLSLRNALDKRYEVYAYVPQPGLAIYGGLSLQLAE